MQHIGLLTLICWTFKPITNKDATLQDKNKRRILIEMEAKNYAQSFFCFFEKVLLFPGQRENMRLEKNARGGQFF